MSAAGAILLNWERSGNASSDDLCVVSDERIVAAAKIGHEGAFDDLYQRHAEKMLRITYRINEIVRTPRTPFRNASLTHSFT
jgi:hypothetical protein